MMEVEFTKNPNSMIRCKTIEALVKKEQVKNAFNQQLGKAGLKKSHAFQEFWDALGDYADELSEEEQGCYLANLEQWHNSWLRGEHPAQTGAVDGGENTNSEGDAVVEESQ